MVADFLLRNSARCPCLRRVTCDLLPPPARALLHRDMLAPPFDETFGELRRIADSAGLAEAVTPSVIDTNCMIYG